MFGKSNKGEKPPKVTKASFKKALRIFKYIKPYRLQFSLGLFFLLGSSAASLIFPKMIGDLIDEAQTSLIDNINSVAIGLIILFAAQALFSYLRIIVFVNVTEKSLADIRQDTYAHLIKLPMSFFATRRIGELNSRISADISLLQETFTTTLAEFLRQIIIIFGGIAILVFSSPELTLFMLAVVPAVIVVTIFFGKFIRKFSKETQNQVAESNTIVEETLQGISNVKAFANEFFEIARYTAKTDQVARTAIRGGKYRGAFVSFIIFGLFGALTAVIWYGAHMVQEGELEMGQLFSFLLYTAFIGGSIGGLANVYASIQKAVGATEKLMEILDEETEDIKENNGVLDIKGSIQFDNVSFAYQSRADIDVLKAMSFEAKPGEHIAIVGASGAGKTTLVSLLLQFYHASTGSVKIDGKLVEDYDLHSLRNSMALVPQEILLFGGSIRENIAYGNPLASEEEIIEAAKKARVHQFVSKFSEGYDTLVGERGIQLSGGQRQRVAIARAILKDPAILILDEATSALDSESERLVQEALSELTKNRTSIVIAHRLSTIKSADRILVLENGEIIEQGNHDELLQMPNGVYKKLSDLQLS
ncbi:MAG: ABC-type multidrug transport system fused ATPase/permease subunit [Candidatus Azotimanducaceae bacterium]|jgi:ABC-type multidrug transport system fused ATPase/permease subunit